ncbi:Fungal lipase-type domain-containing protein [Caenorhabditis elegans]|uniref:Fungal lipase-type domain-containing protein n=1 Tax=Caenorhabditis elegans TaxID=6239 RepID=Q20478_CAEEL|nr:Fungal lipase-like domain-containing protein [Caenorhabditis elegans]CAA90544.1 Fungal lipase-like domain-containing protein [Caenorhabditis elegans]|eukprot:NP_510221.1 Uncharacterized protein CELE_F46G10.4 [Caenorhabditis elegans]
MEPGNKSITITPVVYLLLTFFHSVSGYALYREVEAEQFLNLAAAAYADASNVTARQSCLDYAFPTDEFHVLMVMSTPCDRRGNQCQAFIAISDSTNQVIISFRGTNSGGQLLSEFGVGLEDYAAYTEIDGSNNTVSVGHVNVYFLDAMNQMWEDMVQPSIKNRQNYTFLITGHSLGGAMATLTAFRIAFRQFSSRIKVHTFGEPRVGDTVFASYFTDMVPYAFRVVHNTDPIPHLPPLNVANEAGPGMPYHHPREIWYNDDFSNYVMCSDVNGEDWSCSDKKRFWNYGSKGAYRHTHYFNHFVSEYGALGCNSTPHKQTILLSIFVPIFAIFSFYL